MPELYLETGYHHFPSHSIFHHIICNRSPISLTATYLPQLIGYFYVWIYISRCYGEGSLRHETANTEMKVLLQKGFVILQLLTLRLLMSYIYGAPSKARNANVVYIWTYVWQYCVY